MAFLIYPSIFYLGDLGGHYIEQAQDNEGDFNNAFGYRVRSPIGFLRSPPNLPKYSHLFPDHTLLSLFSFGNLYTSISVCSIAEQIMGKEICAFLNWFTNQTDLRPGFPGCSLHHDDKLG